MRVAKLMAVGAIVMAGLGVGGVASADEPCTYGWICVYGNNDFNWKMVSRGGGYGVANIAAVYNDKMDSWRNTNATHDAAWYHNSSGTGTCRTMRRASSDNDISFTDSDKLSSWRTDVGC